MKYIKFQEEKLFTKTIRIFRLFWLNLVILFLLSLFAMILAQFALSSFFAEKTGLFTLFFLLYLVFTFGSAFISLKTIKKSIMKDSYDKNALFIVYFISMLLVGLLFSGIFLIIEKTNPLLWFLKTSFLGIMLMIIYWCILAILFFSNKIYKKLNH